MKWFKHDGNALHDAKIEKLVMKYGVEGYGLYFACVEIIAGSLGPENFTFELEHDAEILAYKFKVDTLRVEEIMKYCVTLGLFELNGNNRITCMTLAKRLDNTMIQNPEIKETLRNLKQLEVTDIRLDQIRKDKKKEYKSSAKPATTEKAAKETTLHQSIREAFLSQDGGNYDFGREGKHINAIIARAEKASPADPAEYIHAVMEAFAGLKQNGSRFWNDQPFLPSVLNSAGIWPRVLETMREPEPLDEESARIIDKAFP